MRPRPLRPDVSTNEAEESLLRFTLALASVCPDAAAFRATYGTRAGAQTPIRLPAAGCVAVREEDGPRFLLLDATGALVAELSPPAAPGRPWRLRLAR